MPRRVLCVVNPEAAAGRARTVWAVWRSRCARESLVVDEAFSDGPGHALQLARARAADYDVVVAAGGDGTVNEVANGLLLAEGARAALAILPLGTGNDAATQLGVLGLDAAAASLARGAPRTLDVIETHFTALGQSVTRYALLFAAVGFAGELIKRTTPRVKRIFGARLCYSVGFFRALGSYRAPRMVVRAGSQQFRGRMFHVCAGNAEWGGGGVMRHSPGARWDDGKMDICLIQALGRLETVRYFPRLLRGSHVNHPKATYLQGDALEVESDPPLELQLDGDLVGRTPASFRLQPGRLTVLAPPM
jgi:YegS/Rv2252/BmrU family lipid kinase